MQELRFAVKNTIPIFFTYLFIGIAFGILTVDAGYSVLLSVASAFFIFAGSMQLVMIPMMTSGASLATLALMTFFINARHIFYGISFVERFRKMGWRGVYMVLTLTDETYSVLCSVQFEPGLDEDRATFYIALLNHFYWIFGCLVGACAGRLLPFDMTGIDFSATAFFLVVVINQWRQYRTKLPFLTAATCALGFYLLLGKDYFLIPTLITCLIADAAQAHRSKGGPGRCLRRCMPLPPSPWSPSSPGAFAPRRFCCSAADRFRRRCATWARRCRPPS